MRAYLSLYIFTSVESAVTYIATGQSAPDCIPVFSLLQITARLACSRVESLTSRAESVASIMRDRNTLTSPPLLVVCSS